MEDFVLRAPKGATTSKKILGRGSGTGKQKTAGKGNKGQKARSGGGVRPGFEGGQMPLYRRIARRGFSNYPFKKEYVIINVGSLNKKFSDGEEVTFETLKAKGLVGKKSAEVKILGQGELEKKLTVKVERISQSAKDKIEKAGGTIIQQKE